MIMPSLRSAALVLVLGLPSAGWAGGDAPAAAETPIDCPLHAKGVHTSDLKPFAETEKYIEFLERPDRAAWQKPDAVVAALGLKGTETVADVGAGSGYFTFRFAKALPRGKVVATDIDPEMIRHIHHKVLTEGIKNVSVAIADAADPTVPGGVDLVFISDVLHHVQGREAWLGKLAAEVKPGARLVVIEFREGQLPQGPPEQVKISKAELVRLVQAAGFALEKDDPAMLPYQTFMVFRRQSR
jgi:2-polyprenyl-3-methyl-5-hydroxy-6-metoxy-1,4-benzoquinol methylase